jgi:hypothetical protein
MVSLYSCIFPSKKDTAHFKHHPSLYPQVRRSLSYPWNEPYPDHTWISRTFRKIPLIYLECILLSSAYLCLKESDWRKGILASDSTGVETDRYDYEVRLVKSKRKFEKILVKQYLKWHVTAILDHLIILSTRLTSKKTHDSPVLRTMLNRSKKYGRKGKMSLTV